MYYETLKGYLLLTVLKSAPGQNSKCFCLKALEIPLRKISISCRRKLLSQQERYTQLDWIQEIFLRWYFISLSLEEMEWMRVELSRTVTHFLHLQMYNLLDWTCWILECFEHRKYVLQWPNESNFAFSAKKKITSFSHASTQRKKCHKFLCSYIY